MKQIPAYYSIQSQKEYGPLKPRPLWTPSDISTFAWFDPSDESTIVESGGFVSQLDDKSGNNNHVDMSYGGYQPQTGTRQLNGLNVLDVTGGLKYLRNQADLPALFNGSPAQFDMTTVFKNDAAVYPQYYHETQGNGSMESLRLGVSSTSLSGSLRGVGGQYTYFSLPHDLDTEVKTTNCACDGSAMYHRVDAGIPLVESPVVSTSIMDTFQLGSHRYTSQDLEGVVAEVIVLSTKADDTVRQKIEGYLAWKWGTVDKLPVGHPYKDAPPYI